MKKEQLENMDVDSLWLLQDTITDVLTRKICAKKALLEERLKRLEAEPAPQHKKTNVGRRAYPPVFPRFRNPNEPSQTWAGRGKQPRWMADLLRSGKQMDDFRIAQKRDAA